MATYHRRRRRKVVAPQHNFGSHQRHRRAVMPNTIEAPGVGLGFTYEEFLRVKQFEIDNPLQNLILSMLNMNAAKEVSAWDTEYYKDVLMNPLKSTNNVLVICAMLAVVLVICLICCGGVALTVLYFKGRKRRLRMLAAHEKSDDDRAKTLDSATIANAPTSGMNYNNSAVSLSGYGNNMSAMSMMGGTNSLMGKSMATQGASDTSGINFQSTSAVEPESRRKLNAVFKKNWIDKMYEAIFGETDLEAKLNVMYDIDTAEMELQLAAQQLQSHLSFRPSSRAGSRMGSRSVSSQGSLGQGSIAPPNVPGLSLTPNLGMSPQIQPMTSFVAAPTSLSISQNPALHLSQVSGMAPMGSVPVANQPNRERSLSATLHDIDNEESGGDDSSASKVKKNKQPKSKWSGLDKAYNMIFDKVLGADPELVSSDDEESSESKDPTDKGKSSTASQLSHSIGPANPMMGTSLFNTTPAPQTNLFNTPLGLQPTHSLPTGNILGAMGGPYGSGVPNANMPGLLAPNPYMPGNTSIGGVNTSMSAMNTSMAAVNPSSSGVNTTIGGAFDDGTVVQPTAENKGSTKKKSAETRGSTKRSSKKSKKS
ncbi:hypothetical protein SARC_04715 [Sphaeroforma arctica JP610]|uniref:Uncharacterized protein n=1 Tax=Sphaeroforma arctica JP610 TaxID=667725 RepID=A0A0L0G1J3_9EUKA|nr:hypothetical protein SARC_04715 [Sphaeroforma arctica JP610]KNC83012.1 hypothetical protein SARC_04715 [Sphaeroforma arctica JP610]|eukprot:XP_014156914.1 hypothetical protein SARC_04715 [Sphaeroforma arctica JP610]